MLAYSEFINYCYSILPLASYETSDILLYLMVVYELLVVIGLLAHLCCSFMFFRLTQIYCHRRLLGYDRLHSDDFEEFSYMLEFWIQSKKLLCEDLFGFIVYVWMLWSLYNLLFGAGMDPGRGLRVLGPKKKN